MKKTVALLLCLVLCLSAAGCGAAPAEVPPAAGEAGIIDGAGALRALPADPESVTIASVYAVTVPLIVALGLSDRVVAVNVKSAFWKDAVPGLAAAGTVGRGVVDLEALAGFAPDVFLHRSNDPKTVEAVEKLGIPTLCVTLENMEDIKTTLGWMGRYFGAEARAAEVTDWLDGKFAMLAEKAASIPAERRATALLMGGEPGRVAGNDMLQSWMIETAGGVCVADIGKDHNWVDAGVETVFRWNPEFLFCTGSTALDYSPEELLADPAWSAVEAVKRGNVLRVPAKLDAWDMPGISCVLGVMFMMHAMYPELLSAGELQSEIDEYYTFLFGRTFDAGYLGYELE